MRVERENTFSFMYVLGSGSSDTYNTCVLYSHMWLVRLVRLTDSDSDDDIQSEFQSYIHSTATQTGN